MTSIGPPMTMPTNTERIFEGQNFWTFAMSSMLFNEEKKINLLYQCAW